MWMTPSKKSLIAGRLAKRLRHLGLSNLGQYFNRVQAEDQERQQMLNLVSTHETHFFREPRQFDYIAEQMVPYWMSEAETGHRSHTVRVWSAGCSSGEEPYSIAMLLLHHLPSLVGWQIQILATDMATNVLETAQRGVWPIEKSREIPPVFLRRFMLKGVGPSAGTMKAGAEIQSVIRFSRLNLHDESYPLQGTFDLIFCRNVLIYFDQRSKERVLGRLFSHLAPDGRLLLGHAENLSGFSDLASGVFTNVYAHASCTEYQPQQPRGRLKDRAKRVPKSR
jgi:chemotaxis protein methyltransferase CheR